MAWNSAPQEWGESVLKLGETEEGQRVKEEPEFGAAFGDQTFVAHVVFPFGAYVAKI